MTKAKAMTKAITMTKAKAKAMTRGDRKGAKSVESE